MTDLDDLFDVKTPIENVIRHAAETGVAVIIDLDGKEKVVITIPIEDLPDPIDPDGSLPAPPPPVLV